MKFQSKVSKPCACIAAALLALISAGCGELVNGANLKPIVKYRPASTAVTSAETATAVETASTDTVAAGGVGTLRGKVVLNGTFVTLPPLYEKGADVKDAAVCGAATAPNESIVVNDGGLANVFVYLKKAPKVSSASPADASMFFDQKACVFKPHAVVVRVGQTVKVLNDDSVLHNTHTNPVKNSPFNKAISASDRDGVALVYKQAEQDPISVTCDVHSWMKAYHLPVDHPFAAVSSANGTFEIKDLPAGKHEFKVWHESAGPSGGLLEKSLTVTIKPGDNELTIPVSLSQLGR